VFKRQILRVGHAIDAGTRPSVNADKTLSWEKRAQVADRFLSGHLICADFKNWSRQIEGLANRPHDAVEKVVHRFALIVRLVQSRLKSIVLLRPAFTSQINKESSGSRYFSGISDGGMANRWPGVCPGPAARDVTVTRYEPGAAP